MACTNIWDAIAPRQSQFQASGKAVELNLPKWAIPMTTSYFVMLKVFPLVSQKVALEPTNKKETFGVPQNWETLFWLACWSAQKKRMGEPPFWQACKGRPEEKKGKKKGREKENKTKKRHESSEQNRGASSSDQIQSSPAKSWRPLAQSLSSSSAAKRKVKEYWKASGLGSRVSGLGSLGSLGSRERSGRFGGFGGEGRGGEGRGGEGRGGEGRGGEGREGGLLSKLSPAHCVVFGFLKSKKKGWACLPREVVTDIHRGCKSQPAHRAQEWYGAGS